MQCRLGTWWWFRVMGTVACMNSMDAWRQEPGQTFGHISCCMLHKLETLLLLRPCCCRCCCLTVMSQSLAPLLAQSVADLDLFVTASCQHQCSAKPCWAATNHNHRSRQPGSSSSSIISSNLHIRCCCC